MNGRNVIEAIMEKKGTTQGELAKLVGFPGQSTVSEKLKRDIKISVFIKMVNALGYEVIVRERGQGRKHKGDIILDGVEERNKNDISLEL